MEKTHNFNMKCDEMHSTGEENCGSKSVPPPTSPPPSVTISVIRKHMKEKKVESDDDSSDSEDSWLDDEQWYCEHLARLSGRVKVTASVQQNPANLK
jgi:hypothetical protein